MKFVLCLAFCASAFAAVNYASYLGVPNASAAAADSAGNVWIVAGSSLIQLAPDGSTTAVTTPVPGATLNAVAIDANNRVIVAGATKAGGVVARIPDLTTAVSAPVARVVVDPNGDWFALAAPALLFKLSGTTGAVVSTVPLGGASTDAPADLAVDASGSPVAALVTNSAELPGVNGFQLRMNGVAGTVSYDGGNFFYGVYSFDASINQWLILSDKTTMYAATQGQGIYHSADRGQTWDQRSSGLPSVTVNAVAVDPTTPATLYAATPLGLAKSVNSGTSWTTLTSTAATTVAVSPKDHNQVFTAGGCTFSKSTDAGKTWAVQTAADGCIVTFLIDPNDVNGVFAIAASGVFQGPNWTRVSSLPGIVAAYADPVAFTTWYASAQGGLYKSADKGATWSLVNAGDFTALAVSKPHLLAGTAAGALQVSLDGGATWNPTLTQPNGSQPVRSLLADSGTYFVGTSYLPEIWVAKLSPFDFSVLYSTFLGGSGNQFAARLAVDSQAFVTVAFETDSTDIVTTLDAFQRRPGGGVDLVLTRLTPGFGLQYSSYLGGSGEERIGSIRYDGAGFLYLTGSRDGDAMVSLMTQGLGQFVFSNGFGGTAADKGIALLPVGANAVLVGQTQSPDLPVTAGPAFNSPADSFVASFTNLIGYQPIQGIVNAASLLPGPVAPQSLATIQGTFGDLNGVTVTFNGIGATVVQVRDKAMDVEVPAGVTVGQDATVLVSSQTGLYQSTVPVNSTAPGLFSANGDGQGVALGQIVRVDTTTGTSTVEPIFSCDQTTCTPIPIDIGDDTTEVYLVLTATGLRNQTDLSQFQVTVGGIVANVVDVSPQGVAPGLDSVTIQLPQPDGVAGPLEWKIQVTVDGHTSNAVSIWVE